MLSRVVAMLDGAGIPFMIAGSFASTTHGAPRSTQDLDVVIDPPSLTQLEQLVRGLPPSAYYVDLEAARDAWQRRSMFNVVELGSGWKIDFILRKGRAFSRAEFERRQAWSLFGVPVWIASPEDTVVSKLEWSHMSGGSERQRRDVAGVLATSGASLDRAYIERWVTQLHLEEEWAHVMGPGDPRAG
jgi:hypothetical protein